MVQRGDTGCGGNHGIKAAMLSCSQRGPSCLDLPAHPQPSPSALLPAATHPGLSDSTIMTLGTLTVSQN